MDATTIAVTLLAGAGVGSLITATTTWQAREADENRKAVVLARQATVMAATFEAMLIVVVETDASGFDERRLIDLVSLLRSPEFLGAVRPDKLVRTYGDLSITEVEHLQFERLYPRFAELHAKALLGSLSATENLELGTVEGGLRTFAKRALQRMRDTVKPELQSVARALEARARTPWDDDAA